MTSPSSNAHRQAAKSSTARCAVLTVSDTRTPETDTGGDRIVRALEAAGHAVVARGMVRDEPAEVDARLRAWIADEAVQVILTTGGTGLARRDTTASVVERLLDQRIPGFGELFRMLSFEEVGAAAMLSRAVAGIADDTTIFSMPGSPNAVQLAMERLIVPELRHLVWERGRHEA